VTDMGNRNRAGLHGPYVTGVRDPRRATRKAVGQEMAGITDVGVPELLQLACCTFAAERNPVFPRLAHVGWPREFRSVTAWTSRP